MPFFVFLLFASLLTSCIGARTDFIPEQKITIAQKDPLNVECLQKKPARAHLCLGKIRSEGHCMNNHQDVVQQARKRAALLGADFIIVEQSGERVEAHVRPGQETTEVQQVSALASPDTKNVQMMTQQVVIHKKEPEVSYLHYPWVECSAWVYPPSRSGIDLDETHCVTGFHLNCVAEDQGMQLGDRVIGIDGIDVRDECLAQHLMEIAPGDEMVYIISREGKRMEFHVKALKN